jgi:hypothetical protein
MLRCQKKSNLKQTPRYCGPLEADEGLSILWVQGGALLPA